MLQTLAPGDVVAVTRIDRLARSTFDLFSIIKRDSPAGFFSRQTVRERNSSSFKYWLSVAASGLALSLNSDTQTLPVWT
jgi:hypothetical protein